MKFPRKTGFACPVAALTTIILGAGPARAEADFEKYAPLKEALIAKKLEVLIESEEAGAMVAAYRDFLRDPDVDPKEKRALRKELVAERIRHDKLQEQVEHLRNTIRTLRHLPNDEGFTLTALRAGHEDLAWLGAKGRTAWEQLLSDREQSIEALANDYKLVVAEAETRLKELNTVGRANEILFNAIDSRRIDASAEEFRLALKLPRIKTAVELGFGIRNQTDNPEIEAQTTLIALIGYSQFFWDHSGGEGAQSATISPTRDARRNIFGVANGEVLTSDAIIENRSSLYYLSHEAREKFNDKIRGIWGPQAAVDVKRWDQRYARSFHHACKTLSTTTDSTTTDSTLVPNPMAIELLGELELLIENKRQAEEELELIHAGYQKRMAQARQFGDEARLSSVQFKATSWAKEASSIIARAESARRLLDEQLAASAREGWVPDTKGIEAGVQALRNAHRRLQSVLAVKVELTDLLEESDS